MFGSDLWASDWSAMTPKAELDLVMSRLEKAGKGVILFHDSKAATAKMLPEFLRELKKRGYRVAHMVPGRRPDAGRAGGAGLEIDDRADHREDARRAWAGDAGRRTCPSAGGAGGAGREGDVRSGGYLTT